MQFGLFAIGADLYATEPEHAIEVACAAEAAGWESVWVGEHYALPDPATPNVLIDPSTPMLDPFVALTHIAARTTTLRVGTGVIVLPLHHPVHLAKQIVSLDRIAPGRLLLGIGVGYIDTVLTAFGTSMGDRGRNADDMLASLRSLFDDSTPRVTWRGQTTNGLRAEPRPLRVGGPPLHIGGHGAATFRRVATVGDGWYGWCVPPEGVGAARQAIDDAKRTAGRDGPIEISITPPLDSVITADLVDRYREVGVDRLVVMPPIHARTDLGAALDFVQSTMSLS